MRFSSALSTVALTFVLALQPALGQVVLPQLDPVSLDTSYQSYGGAPALINFVNLEPFAVDIYWIDYSGERVLYSTLNAGSAYYQGTYITHPWIAAQVGSGDTLVQGTGQLLDGFLAQTVNPSQDLLLADVAYIGAVPEPAAWMLALVGTVVVGRLAASRRSLAAPRGVGA